MKYYYGTPDSEMYYNQDIDSAYEEIRDYDCDGDEQAAIGLEIIEMVVSKKSGITFCPEIMEFEPGCGIIGCGINNCGKYTPRNGKNGICKYLTYALIPTGRKWKIVGDYKYIKISGRKKQ